MGIDLGDVVAKRPTSLAAWSGRTLAVDAWNILYQFLSAIRQPDGTPLRDAQGRTTSHLAGVLYRCAALLEAGVKTVWVFDGEPHPLKRETLAARGARREKARQEHEDALAAGDTATARTKAQQASRMSAEMATQARRLLEALGIPVVEAPGEGEAQAAWMAAQGRVDGVASQDFDALLFGAPTLVRNVTVTGRRKLPGKQVWIDVAPEQIPLHETLEALGLDREALVDVALLVGTDFHPGIKGIGAKKAVQLVRTNGGLEPLLERLAADPASAASAVERAIVEQHEALAERDTVRRLLLQPTHADVPVPPTRADHREARRLMVDEHGFSADRVDQALRRFEAARGRASQQRLF